MNTGKEAIIRSPSELAREFGRFVAETPRFKGLHFSPPQNPQQAKVDLDGVHHVFDLHYELAPSAQDLSRWFATPDAASRALLVVPHLTSALLATCREARLSAADLNGRLFLRAPGLLVELPAISGRRFRFEQEPRNIFVGKSARVVRALLADPRRPWRQAELVARTGATSGLVSRIVTHLERQGLLSRSGSGKRFQTCQLLSPDALLDAWAEADDFASRTTTYRYHGFEQDPVRLARKLRNALTHHGPHFAFTQWIAAWLRAPYTEPPLVSLYVPQLPPPDLIESLGLKPVADGGRVWFHLPSDEGVFRETRVVEDLPLVSDAQIYLDLQATGLRGPDQARALREHPDFCRP